MKRTVAHQIIRWGLVATGSWLACAAGYYGLRSNCELVPDAQAEGLQRVNELPRLLALPQDVVPVALDFVPPVPEVGYGPTESIRTHRIPAPVTVDAGPRPLAAEPQPQGFYGAPQARPSITRLPAVTPPPPVQSPPIQAPPIQEPPAQAPRRTSSFVPVATEAEPQGSFPLLIDRLEDSPRATPESSPAPPRVASLPPRVELAPPGSAPPGSAPVTAPPRASSPAQDAPLQAVNERATALVAHGTSLADRGALFTARAEFIQALRMVTQALDAQQATTAHSQALADGLRALAEAADFSPGGSQLEADLDLQSIIAGHRTAILKDVAPQSLTSLVALQRYYAFAQERLSAACGREPAASQALYGLGKLTTVMAQRSPEARRMHGPQAMAYYQAALAVDSGNALAAQELGAMLAQFGQWQEARQALLHGLAISATPAAWHNLAVVHDRLGEADLATKARYEMQLAKRSTGLPLGAAPRVQWLDPDTFAQASPENMRRGDSPATAPAAAPVQPAPRAARSGSSLWNNPWLK
jgi:tetratricopeptide (TPR) repeat protein